MLHVVGIGLDGVNGLTPRVQAIIAQATLLVGSARHLSYFPDHPADRLVLKDFGADLQTIPTDTADPIVILTSGDPLFFGLGRLLLETFPAESLTFHPHLSSMQLAFSRVKVPWQDAHLISAHGRSLEELTRALQQGTDKIAVLTDPVHSPGAIAQLIQALELPSPYDLWVCENLGGPDEQVQHWQMAPGQPIDTLLEQSFASLNVVVLVRQTTGTVVLENLPLLGIPDSWFLSFSDRPGLITKREIRTLVLGELQLQPEQVIWDIGAGTGSVSVEMARLVPQATIYAIEKTAAGALLIQQNCQRFQVTTVQAIQGSAPSALTDLPAPDRIFIGGSGGQLTPILEVCQQRLAPDGRIVLALATLEHLSQALSWLQQQQWEFRCLQVQVSRSVPVAGLTRFAPLNPVTLVIAERSHPSLT